MQGPSLKLRHEAKVCSEESKTQASKCRALTEGQERSCREVSSRNVESVGGAEASNTTNANNTEMYRVAVFTSSPPTQREALLRV